MIAFDLLNGTIAVNISDEDMAARRAKLAVRPSLEPRRGYLSDWSATVAQANYGCVSKAMYPECT